MVNAGDRVNERLLILLQDAEGFIQAEFPQDGPLKLSLDIDFAGEKGKLEVTL